MVTEAIRLCSASGINAEVLLAQGLKGLDHRMACNWGAQHLASHMAPATSVAACFKKILPYPHGLLVRRTLSIQYSVFRDDDYDPKL
ncbi:hypothetical protein OPT61_g2294 [Boeremia exigua]|uniref:Uncharacterized protein n=1 Tax=Boeremia exigua TaxID=749465 RepID=A0ACC2IM03_9PLEO|nr:hypothetical protein OPT61_g2294 [Boeremia exigua]